MSDLGSNDPSPQTPSPAATAMYRISGKILDDNGDGVPGVDVKFLGNELAVARTNQYGEYVSPDLKAHLVYSITPEKPAYEFSSADPRMTELVGNVNGRNFLARLNFYQMSGTVRDTDGNPASDVLLTLEGQTTQATRSNENGTYTFFPVPGAHPYVIRPAKVGFTFSPSTSPIAYLAANVVQDFYSSIDPALAKDKAPNEWSTLNDYSKTVITLASAFLAVTVTFSGQLIGKGADSGSIGFLMVTWVFLVLAIASGVFTVAFLINYLRHKKGEKPAIFFANTSYVFLLLAGAFFLLVGWRSIYSRKSSDINQVIEATLKKMPEKVSRGQSVNSTWSVESFEVPGSLPVYRLVVIERATSRKFQVWVDPVKQEPIKIELLSTAADEKVESTPP